MALYRGPGGAGDATNDANSQAILAKEAAIAAAASQTAAATSATSADNSASSANTSATNAANSATAAQTAQTAAELAETNAETAEANAETAEANATASAALAQDWATKTSGPVAGGEYSSKYNAQLAATSATNAANSATSASTSASAASTSATNAASSATSAATSATNASTSATSAASSASTATTKAAEADTSATAAAASATTATTKASEAASSATAAASSASAASTSATNAASSATAAASSASAASISETNAAASETAAATSETNAASSASAAATSATNAAASAIDAQSSEDAAAAYAASINPANLLAKANNLSDLTNTSTARNNLGVAIGINVQAYSSELQAISDGGGNAMFKNRIINGAMMIDQRNAGASVTPNNDVTLDRWGCGNSQTGKFTVQQSSVAPAGFSYSALITSTSAYSVGSGDYFSFYQRIEGYNVADLGFGTASPKAITISFWVRSSLTGTFGAAVQNAAYDRSYPFSYTISAANTWEQKSVTLTADTTGTWNTTNGRGLAVNFSLGYGSSYSSSANSWQAGNFGSVTGATSVVGTNGATFYITGVQLEKGSTATSFDYRPYGTELALCQRYYVSEVITSGEAYTLSGFAVSGRAVYPTQMRASPTLLNVTTIASNNLVGSPAISTYGQTAKGVTIYQATGSTGQTFGYWSFNVSAEL